MTMTKSSWLWHLSHPSPGTGGVTSGRDSWTSRGVCEKGALAPILIECLLRIFSVPPQQPVFTERGGTMCSSHLKCNLTTMWVWMSISHWKYTVLLNHGFLFFFMISSTLKVSVYTTHEQSLWCFYRNTEYLSLPFRTILYTLGGRQKAHH